MNFRGLRFKERLTFCDARSGVHQPKHKGVEVKFIFFKRPLTALVDPVGGTVAFHFIVHMEAGSDGKGQILPQPYLHKMNICQILIFCAIVRNTVKVDGTAGEQFFTAEGLLSFFISASPESEYWNGFPAKGLIQAIEVDFPQGSHNF